VFRLKKNVDGDLKYKARLVAEGSTQAKGKDYSDMNTPVAKFSSIQCLLAIGSYASFHFEHMDVKTPFLNGLLGEEFHEEEPDGFKSYTLVVCLL
jgi:hypothetical protein